MEINDKDAHELKDMAEQMHSTDNEKGEKCMNNSIAKYFWILIGGFGFGLFIFNMPLWLLGMILIFFAFFSYMEIMNKEQNSAKKGVDP